MKINSDKISEKYRKYISGLRINGELLYVIWGTDLTNLDFDYFLLNSSNKLICFRSLTRLKSFINTSDYIFIDDINVRNWNTLYQGDQPYVIYDLDMLVSLLLENKNSVLKFSKKNKIAIYEFIAFFSDYIFQTNNLKFLKIYSKKRQKYFRFLVGSNFININLNKELSLLNGDFDSNQFKLEVLYMIDFFIKNVDIVE